MKRQERQHLKENDLAHTLAVTRDFVAERGKHVGLTVGIIVAIGVIALAYMGLKQRSNRSAEEALAQAVVTLNARVIPPSDPDAADLPASASIEAAGTFRSEKAKLEAAVPKLKAAVDAHPDKEAGIEARYRLAGALAALGRTDEAIAEFGEVVKRAPKDSVWARMARMGLADTQTRSGQLDAAITSWKQLADDKTADLPEDAILMELGRAYVAKGNAEEARKTFTQLLEKHPTSPYSADAKTELDALKG